MKRNKLIILATAISLVAGIGTLSRFSTKESEGEWMASMEEESEGRSIQGAIESFYSMRLNEATGTLEPEWIKEAIAQADKIKVTSRAAKPIVWKNMGPDNIGGRIRAFLMHRDSANLMFAGGVSGGLFRSNTGGLSWRPVNDLQQNLNVNCIAQTPNGIIYYGTGEGFYTNGGGTRNGSPAFDGLGVFKSTDNTGKTFTSITNTKSWTRCNVMLAHPTEDWLWVANEAGLYKTSNGGTSWTLVRGGAILDAAIDKDGIIWCSNNIGTIYKGNVDGTTFTSVNNGITPGGRTSIAISPQDPQYIYLLGSSGGSMSGVWRTTNGGAQNLGDINWDLIVAKSSVTDIFGSNTQGWYDNVIGVDPLDKDKIYLGGVGLAVWDQDKGYREITSQFDMPWNSGYVHADKHVIQFNMRTSPPTMIVGTDGGLFFSQDRATWSPMNRGFTTLQLYNVAANYLGHVMGGSQDNGTQLINFSGNSFNGEPSKSSAEVYGGDGFDVEFSSFNPAVMFVSTYYGNVARSANGGQSSSTFWDLRQDGKVPSDFNTTFTLWEQSEKVSKLFLAKNTDVWVALNPTDFSTPVAWYLLTASLGGDRIIEMDHTPDGDHLFVAKHQRVYRIDSIQSAKYDPNSGARVVPSKIKLVNITPAGANGRTVTSVNVDQSNPNHVVVTLGGYGNSSYVYETENALDAVPTWKNITGNLPSMPVYDAVVDVDDANRIVLATDLGIWLTENGGTSWEEANTGMARVPVYEIRGYEYHPWEGMDLYIGTHGRGFFRSTGLLTSTKKIARDATSLKVYPNPAKENIQVSFDAKTNGKVAMEIFDIHGKKMGASQHESVKGNNVYTINISDLASGYYFAKLTQSGTSGTVKFLVQ
ncbi:MAG: T9SS type A sorting domain-containing protein [Bacteroidetes bacterium]|nr:T9SS type A sorting domain-containing protein [Bacteroidota bacterium]